MKVHAKISHVLHLVLCSYKSSNLFTHYIPAPIIKSLEIENCAASCAVESERRFGSGSLNERAEAQRTCLLLPEKNDSHLPPFLPSPHLFIFNYGLEYESLIG